MKTATMKSKYRRIAAAIITALLYGMMCYCAMGSEPSSNTENSEEIIVKNIWVDVPLSQIFRDISVENGIILATCPHVPDPMVSLDASKGKPLGECLEELIAGQGLFIKKKNNKFYLIVCGDPACPSAVETITPTPFVLKYISAKHLRGSLPKSLQQYVTSGERENEALVYAVPEITDHITELIRKLDIPQEQVMLEVLVVDLWEETSDEFGIDWSVSTPHTAFSMAAGTAGLTGLASYASVAASQLTELSLTLNALIAEKRASIRSRPRVATIDGEKAKIDISLDEYYTIITDLYSTSLRTELEVIKSGVTLEMTPHIGDNGYITVDVQTEVSDVATRRNSSSSTSSSSSSTSTSSSDLPVIRRRKAETHVRVREGDAIVIGGLVETQETTNHTKVPGAGDIPILGWLFKSKEDGTIKKEVMIFITPQIIRDSDVAFADRHKMINAAEEANSVRATDFFARKKVDENRQVTEQEINTLNQVINLLGGKVQTNNTPEDINNVNISNSHTPAAKEQERESLQEAISLLDPKNQAACGANNK